MHPVFRAIFVVLTDGVSVGHVCCSVHDCKEPLADHLQRFCGGHSDMIDICVINGCSSRADKGFLTCAVPEHRGTENSRKLKGKAMVQLKRRLKRAGITGEEDFTDGYVRVSGSSIQYSATVLA